MKTLVRSSKVLVFALLVALGPELSFAQSSQMDRQSYDDLISKLEMLVAEGTSDVPGSSDTLIRLADLYAERARILDFEAGQTNCTDCKGARKDRTAAIKLYQRSLRIASPQQRPRIQFQLAQLHSTLGKNQQASHWYREVLKSADSATQSLAHTGLGDIEFMKPNFKKAADHYQKALVNSRPQDRAYLNYRLAWCALNGGDNASSLSLIKRAISEADSNGQSPFKRDLMRDYATILGRNNFKDSDIQAFIANSNPEDVKENLKLLGEEAERLGNKQGALIIWTKYSQSENEKDGSSADNSLRIAMNQFDLNQRGLAIENLRITSERLKKKKCQDCNGVRVNFKNFLISWNRQEKAMPSLDLIKAYSAYIDAHPDDFEVQIWAAQAAELRKSRKEAAELYMTASMTAQRKGDRVTSDQTMMLAIEQAELAKDEALRENYLRRYLEVHPKGHEAFLVRYQLTLIEYKRAKYDVAARDFRTLALQSEWKDRDLRLKSAELALDSLAQKKDEAQILSWSSDFARAFPQQSLRFHEIHRKTAVNHLTAGIQQKLSDAEIRRRMAIVSAAPLDGASAADRRLILKNLLVTGESLKDLEIVEKSARSLLRQEGLSPQDEELALASLLWVQELRLEFSAAYKTALLMNFSDRKVDQKHLKLGLLAELAGANPQRHYRDFLASTKSSQQANEVRVRLIRRAKNPWNEFDLHARKLQSSPDLFASTALELYLKNPNKARLEKLARTPKMRSTVDGQRLIRIHALQEAQKIFSEVSKMRISSKSDQVLRKSIQSRIRKLDQVRNVFERAAQDGHLSLQANALGAIARENERFANEIRRLPVPRGLNKSEQAIYRTMIQDQAKPFETAAREANDLLEDFMDKNSAAIDELSRAVISGSTTDRLYAKFEYQSLRRLMSNRQAGKVESALAKTRISDRELESAKRKVRQNPLESSAVETLRELVARQGNGPLIAFLDLRLAQMQSEGRR